MVKTSYAGCPGPSPGISKQHICADLQPFSRYTR